MPIEPDGPAPYAPPSTVLATIGWHRDRGLPTPITSEVIARVVDSESLAPRIVKTLRLFGLTDDAGNPTPQFEELAKAPTDNEFKQRLGAIVQYAYADVLQYINPETATLEQIEGQFRRYTPRGQRERMVVLFRNLCVYTGIIPSSGEDGHIDTVPRQRQSKPAATRERTMTQERKPPSPPKPNGDRASTPVRHPELPTLATCTRSSRRSWNSSPTSGESGRPRIAKRGSPSRNPASTCSSSFLTATRRVGDRCEEGVSGTPTAVLAKGLGRGSASQPRGAALVHAAPRFLRRGKHR